MPSLHFFCIRLNNRNPKPVVTWLKSEIVRLFFLHIQIVSVLLLHCSFYPRLLIKGACSAFDWRKMFLVLHFCSLRLLSLRFPNPRSSLFSQWVLYLNQYYLFRLSLNLLLILKLKHTKKKEQKKRVKKKNTKCLKNCIAIVFNAKYYL